MKQKEMAGWLKGIIIGIGVLGIFVYGYLLPIIINGLLEGYPEFSYWYAPWMAFLWLTALPCFGALFCAWQIAGEIGRDNSFCMKNAGLMKAISILAAGDSAALFLGNVVLFFLGMNHPSIFLFSMVILFIGICITIAAAVLSHLIYEAASMKEEQELTI